MELLGYRTVAVDGWLRPNFFFFLFFGEWAETEIRESWFVRLPLDKIKV